MTAIGLAFVIYVLFGALSDVLIRHIYGMGSAEMIRDIDSFLAAHSNLNPYRFLQMASTVFIFGGAGLLTSYLLTGRLSGILDFSKKANLPSLATVPFIIIFIFPIIMLVHLYMSGIDVPPELAKMEANLETFTQAMLSDTDIGIFALNFLMIAILPAIFEEVLFRGVIQRLAGRLFGNAHFGILLSGLMFGFIHGQVFKFLPIAILGILLGYLYYWTRNLWFPVLGHFFNNAMQVVIYFAAAKGWVELDMESPQMIPPAQVALCAVLFAGTAYLFYYTNRKTADEPY